MAGVGGDGTRQGSSGAGGYKKRAALNKAIPESAHSRFHGPRIHGRCPYAMHRGRWESLF